MKLEINTQLIVLFGKKVKEHRIKQGITQAQLGYESDMPREQIGRVERGQVNISLKKIESICKALDIQPKDLFDFELRNEEIQP